MPIVVAVLVVLTTLTLLNLLLTFGVIRKLREHTQELAAGRPPVTLSVGAQVPDFTASTDDGDVVSIASLRASGGLVAFLAPDCSGCQEQLPSVRSALAEALDTPAAVLIVLTRLQPAPDREDRERAELVAALGVLDSRATIVHEPLDGAVQSAFQVAAFPAFYLVDTDGRVAGVSNNASQLPNLSPGRDVVPAGR
ncbi:redoxin domain-containing protein [Micromonospora sp. DR5-3]|uniref:peroxiredoxin family protein n=1 Tax=unclassified Micromonospora TaxID=2617518 RepID=UPI0011DB4BA0|nr:MULTISPECIES: redoxin domain-containing protein [unclassified Micromonospora]MCW3815091.1 redoxin domain-containing protein [Micromonospora sp. DR5-3]TYC25400.1 redoxin domain-containing protein [Micromonospora sp. MP36]